MTKKPEWYYLQSAVIPFRIIESRVEILLITSLKKKNWILPKGIIENDLSAQESAAKEAFEEAGVSGEVYLDEIDNYTYAKWGGICRVQVYALKVKKIHRNWQESDLRRRKWFSIDNAINIVERKEIRRILRNFKTLIESSLTPK
jgi:8-oxo-dGTP pyrophosphatase MutT (NUDIX family)